METGSPTRAGHGFDEAARRGVEPGTEPLGPSLPDPARPGPTRLDPARPGGPRPTGPRDLLARSGESMNGGREGGGYMTRVWQATHLVCGAGTPRQTTTQNVRLTHNPSEVLSQSDDYY